MRILLESPGQDIFLRFNGKSKMSDVFKRLNLALLLSHKIYGGPAPYRYRRAWYDLLTIGLNLHDSVSDVFEASLDESLQAMCGSNGNNMAIIESLQNIINVVSSECGNRITRTDADVVIAAAQELIRPLRKPAEQAVQSFN